ncbi:TetR/AcrR family transcriptional regulator [Fibrella aquatilis]|uniref:TetR/AcrR family transcriptional regulator n=1 Tax=Fibrella aquatilis TaxID=2817059 RepID=A0A939G909_9BACT|nr:TetR/AcrR family transcriptional regulator [Fibrella aquatilis]MBO0933448.1 TetR/AcrR family transcriptional regulator [Fibrella aquatilis]
MEKTKRNRAKTTQRILDAFEEVLAERGLQHVGVNRVAERAGVSKVLIYRYFGGLEGLVDHYTKRGTLFPTFTPAVLAQLRPVNDTDLGRVWYRQLTQIFRQFRTSQAARELLKANIISNDSLAEAASKAIDEETQRLIGQLSYVGGADVQAVSAVTIAAMSYMTLLADNNRPMAGIDLRSDEGWNRIEQALKLIYIALGNTVVQSATVSVERAVPVAAEGQWK